MLGNQALWKSEEPEYPMTLKLKGQEICFGKQRNVKLVKLQLARGKESWSSCRVRYSLIPSSLFLLESCGPFGEDRGYESWRGTYNLIYGLFGPRPLSMPKPESLRSPIRQLKLEICHQKPSLSPHVFIIATYRAVCVEKL